MTSFVFTPDFQENLIAHIRVCMEMAHTMQQRFLTDLDFITHKTDNSPVTKADHAVQKSMQNFLHEQCPDILFVGEETVEQLMGTRTSMPDIFWLCDPIDGTRDYARGGADYAINLALIENGTPLFGMIAAPASGHIAITSQRNEVSIVGNQNETHVINTMQPEGTRLIIGSTTSNDAVLFAERFGKKPESLTVRPSALKFHNLLKNEADYYIREGQVSEWDIAAGEALLKAAGGTLTMFDGITPIAYGAIERKFLLDGLYASR